MKKPEIEYHYFTNSSEGAVWVMRDNEHGLNAEEVAKAYEKMIEVLYEFIYKYEHGNGDSAYVDKSLSSTCIDARDALKKAGCEL